MMDNGYIPSDEEAYEEDLTMGKGGKKPCPYCCKEYSKSYVYRHSLICPKSPFPQLRKKQLEKIRRTKAKYKFAKQCKRKQTMAKQSPQRKTYRNRRHVLNDSVYVDLSTSFEEESDSETGISRSQGEIHASESEHVSNSDNSEDERGSEPKSNAVNDHGSTSSDDNVSTTTKYSNRNKIDDEYDPRSGFRFDVVNDRSCNSSDDVASGTTKFPCRNKIHDEYESSSDSSYVASGDHYSSTSDADYDNRSRQSNSPCFDHNSSNVDNRYGTKIKSSSSSVNNPDLRTGPESSIVPIIDPHLNTSSERINFNNLASGTNKVLAPPNVKKEHTEQNVSQMLKSVQKLDPHETMSQDLIDQLFHFSGTI